MAVGVPEEAVFAAADAVLERGERPTVERVRQELGRGSPARVGALLDQWWERLAQRLRGETRLPALPAEVSQAFVAVWQQAMLLADGVAEQAMAEHRAVLEAERLRVAAVENEIRQAGAQARQQEAAAQAAQHTAETRLADLELLLAQRQAQLEDQQSRCAELANERKAALQEASTLRQELQAAQQQLAQERKATATYVQGVEDRAHREVDRAREEARVTAAQLEVRGQAAGAVAPAAGRRLGTTQPSTAAGRRRIGARDDFGAAVGQAGARKTHQHQAGQTGEEAYAIHEHHLLTAGCFV